MQLLRIIESEMDLEKLEGHIVCPYCETELARKGVYKNNRAYWTIRSKINTKRLDN